MLMFNVPTHEESQFNKWKPICSCTCGPIIVTDQIHNTKIYFLSYFDQRAKRFALSCPKIWQGLCHTVALPFTLKSILREKKNSGNSNISPCRNIIFKQSSKGNQDPSSCYNSIMNLKTISLPTKIIFTDLSWKCLERSDGKSPAESSSWSMWRLSSKRVGSRVWAVVGGFVCACIYMGQNWPSFLTYWRAPHTISIPQLNSRFIKTLSNNYLILKIPFWQTEWSRLF
jgi:hypothetical protein